jgi:peroxiredoxin
MADTVADALPAKRHSLLSGKRLAQGLSLLLIIGLCIANGLLIKQNRELKAAIARMGKPPELLRPGQQVPPLAATTLAGQRRLINYADHAKTVLLAFTTQCSSCERVLPYWREIQAACSRNRYQIFGISLDDAPKSDVFLSSNGLNLEAFAHIDAETREAYRLSLAPLTIVVDNNGKVERIWPGVFSQETKEEVERYFGVQVPDDLK